MVMNAQIVKPGNDPAGRRYHMTKNAATQAASVLPRR
jgi:hypothetical protein